MDLLEKQVPPYGAEGYVEILPAVHPYANLMLDADGLHGCALHLVFGQRPTISNLSLRKPLGATLTPGASIPVKGKQVWGSIVPPAGAAYDALFPTTGVDSRVILWATEPGEFVAGARDRRPGELLYRAYPGVGALSLATATTETILDGRAVAAAVGAYAGPVHVRGWIVGGKPAATTANPYAPPELRLRSPSMYGDAYTDRVILLPGGAHTASHRGGRLWFVLDVGNVYPYPAEPTYSGWALMVKNASGATITYEMHVEVIAGPAPAGDNWGYEQQWFTSATPDTAQHLGQFGLTVPPRMRTISARAHNITASGVNLNLLLAQVILAEHGGDTYRTQTSAAAAASGSAAIAAANVECPHYFGNWYWASAPGVATHDTAIVMGAHQ